MAKDNRLWGAERIRGELLKLGIHVCKRTIQKYMRHMRTPRVIWAKLGDLPAHSCWGDLGLRFPARHRPVLPFALCLFHHGTAIAEGHPRRGDAISYRLALYRAVSTFTFLLSVKIYEHSVKIFEILQLVIVTDI
jgi:hypothetical protein